MVTPRTRRRFALIALLAAALVASGLFASPAEAAGQKWALLVGINDYENDEITDLRFTVRDVKAVADSLATTAGFPADNVFVMTSDIPGGGDRPTNLNVLKRL